ncbi:hypothetical protein Tco_0411577 [Tanacetum coccineum]
MSFDPLRNPWSSLIPLSRGSFDVLVGMDWLSRRKFGIVCHEKVVRIPLEGDEILRVHGERTQGVVKTLMKTKVVEFRVDLVSGATPVEKSPYHLAPLEMQELSKQLQELQDEEEHGVHLKLELELLRKEKLYAKANMVTDALSRKERVKPRRVRAMAMTIPYGVRGMILTAQSEAFKKENGMMRTVVMDESHVSRYLVHPGADKTYYNLGDMYWIVTYVSNYWIYLRDNSKEWNSGDDQLRFRWMIYFVVLADAAESGSDAIRFEYCLASSIGWTKSPVLWAEIGESSLIGLALVLDTTDKVVLIKEKLKAARDRQKSCADNRRKPLEFEVGDRVMLKVSPWKGVIRFGKKCKLAPRYVGPFEVLERIGLVAYRFRLPEELSGVHDTFHVSNLKKCLAEASFHVPLDDIKVDKTLRFVEEPVEIMDREVKSLKHSRILIVKVRWNSKCCPEFTWEREDYMKSKYPQLFVDRADESAS